MIKKLLATLCLCATECSSTVFQYETLIHHKPAERMAFQVQILGNLGEFYQNSSLPILDNRQLPSPIQHHIDGIPNLSMGKSKLPLQISCIKDQTGKIIFSLALCDGIEAIMSASISQDQKSRSAKGHLYWNTLPDYKPAISTPVLITLRDTLLIILNVENYTLTDKSYDREIARSFKSEIPLRVLGAYMHRKTYYQAKGNFQPYADQADAYLKAQQLLYDLTCEKVYKDYEGTPHIERLKTKFPLSTRFGEIVLYLYKSARNKDLESFELLQWLNNNCLQNYRGNHVADSSLLQAQQLIINMQEFHKKYDLQ